MFLLNVDCYAFVRSFVCEPLGKTVAATVDVLRLMACYKAWMAHVAQSKAVAHAQQLRGEGKANPKRDAKRTGCPCNSQVDASPFLERFKKLREYMYDGKKLLCV